MDQWKVVLPTGQVLYFEDWDSARIEAEFQRTVFNDPNIFPEKVEE
jgi:hypothetical protein